MNCSSADRCGACTLLGVDYQEQLERKRSEVESLLRSYGIRSMVHPVAGMEEPYHYRNKVIANISMKAGRISYGMYEENSHRVVYAPQCLLQNKVLNDILAGLKEEMDRLHIKAYGFGGVLKQVLLRIGVSSGQVLVVFVTSQDLFPGRAELVKRLVARFDCVRSVVQNTNFRDTSVVLGEREKVLYGPGFVVDDILGVRFKISSRSFYQVNPLQTEVLYSKAIELAAPTAGTRLFDAYCGIGTIGLCTAARTGCSVTGVEINRDAVRDAIANARHSKIVNARFYCADVKQFMRDFDAPADVLILDPPRSGCDAAFLQSVRKLSPARIVYISCNPATQARDVAMLSGQYRTGDAWPVDMFPHTSHIENIITLDLK